MKLVKLEERRTKEDPVEEMYRKIRDAALYGENIPRGLRLAALEMVKCELLAIMMQDIPTEEE